VLYYRFTEDRFLDDDVWARSAELLEGSEEEMLDKDVLPQDVCPQTTE